MRCDDEVFEGRQRMCVEEEMIEGQDRTKVPSRAGRQQRNLWDLIPRATVYPSASAFTEKRRPSRKESSTYSRYSNQREQVLRRDENNNINRMKRISRVLIVNAEGRDVLARSFFAFVLCTNGVLPFPL